MITHPRIDQIVRYVMENKQAQNKVYFHYNHADACNYSRWTAKECYEFMYGRPWQKVLDFYLNVVNGRMSLGGLFGNETRAIHDDAEIVEALDKSELVSVSNKVRTGRWARVTFKIVLSYHGGSFDGWQRQPGLNTVQGLVERSLGKFVDENKAQLLKDKGLPIEGCAIVAGRTDKGVTGFQQVCSFYTWRKDVKARDIENVINDAAPGKLRVISVAQVSRAFHPNFSAKWRRYLYIFPFNDGEDVEQCEQNDEDVGVIDYSDGNESGKHVDEKNIHYILENGKDESESRKKPTSLSVSKVNQLLQQLEGKLLSYKVFARDTKASRNVGPPTECFVFHARAAATTILCAEKDGKSTKAMCIELVANRFLRKMVRVLVATSIREAAAGAEEDSLIKLMDATCRRATAPPAPPDGLCIVDVGYTDFDPQICLIP